LNRPPTEQEIQAKREEFRFNLTIEGRVEAWMRQQTATLNRPPTEQEIQAKREEFRFNLTIEGRVEAWVRQQTATLNRPPTEQEIQAKREEFRFNRTIEGRAQAWMRQQTATLNRPPNEQEIQAKREELHARANASAGVKLARRSGLTPQEHETRLQEMHDLQVENRRSLALQEEQLELLKVSYRLLQAPAEKLQLGDAQQAALLASRALFQQIRVQELALEQARRVETKRHRDLYKGLCPPKKKLCVNKVGD
jgi:hypothetical protein